MCMPPHLRASAAASVARGRPIPPSDATPPFPSRARRSRWMERAAGRWRHRRRSRMRMRMRTNELGAAKGAECVEADGGCDGATHARPESSQVKAASGRGRRVECVFTPGAWGEPTIHTCDASASAGSWPGRALRRRVPTRVVLPYSGQTQREQRCEERRRHTAADLYFVFVFVRGVRVRAKM
jgi:hypothetical protein